MIIAQSLADQIDRKKEIISKDPVYYLRRQKDIEKQSKRDLRAVHSWLIEHPRIRNSILVNEGFSPQTDILELLRRGVDNLDSAWHYLVSTTDYLTSDSLKKTGALIDPGHNTLGYRDRRVSIGMSHTPPHQDKIPGLIVEALDEAIVTGIHPVEKAAMLHLRIAGIQPFADGNKRTSRLYQDRVLYGADLPPAFLPSGERSVYLSLLEQGFEGLRDGKEELVAPFVNYVGGKVNVALDKTIGDISRYHRALRR